MKKGKQIFTEELVKITKQGQLIIGEGFESNTSFSKYTLKNSRGIINLDQVEHAQARSSFALKQEYFSLK